MHVHLIYRVGDMLRVLVFAKGNICVAHYSSLDICVAIRLVNRQNRHPELYLPTVVTLFACEDKVAPER